MWDRRQCHCSKNSEEGIRAAPLFFEQWHINHPNVLSDPQTIITTFPLDSFPPFPDYTHVVSVITIQSREEKHGHQESDSSWL